MGTPEDIKQLFKTRDEAVAKQDRTLFLSTQVTEIDYGTSEGYLRIHQLTSDILYCYAENVISSIVFVKETYSPKDKTPHNAFVLYYLVHTIQGWKISRVK